MAENNLRALTIDRIASAAREYGMQKQLASNLNMSDTELSRLLHDQTPKVVALLSELGLTVVDAEYVTALQKVLKETL